ncbi:MAG: ABC transporter permease [Saprospiraceae bacterium]
MINNYFKIAWRNLIRNKAFSFINVSGLSIGLACCMLIILFTKDELSYDRFHEQTDNLYHLTCSVTEKDGSTSKYALASQIQGPSFMEEIPEIESCVRLHERDYVVRKGSETVYENASFVDDNFFTVFSFPLVQGDPKAVLTDPRSIVISEEISKKYFGDVNPMGKTMELEMDNKFEIFKVTGVAKNAPQNSSIKFNMLLPFKYLVAKNPDDHWLNLSYPTYFVIKENANLENIEAKMAQIFASKAGKEISEERKYGFDATFKYGIQPFASMHLNTEYLYRTAPSNPWFSYILSGIAVFIMAIACINFINLTIAQSLRRSKEIGIRKVIGSERKQLIFQFLGESAFICSFAFVTALLLVQLSLPVFNELSDKNLALNYLFDRQLMMGYLALFIITVFIAGFYPAMVITRFQPTTTLKQQIKLNGKNYLSKGLIVFQFAITTFMVISTLIIYKQFNFLTKTNLGYNDQNLLIVSVGQDANQNFQKIYKSEFEKIPGIKSVAIRQNGFWATGSRVKDKEIPVVIEHVDQSYLPTLEIDLAAGRNFSNTFASDTIDAVMVNEAYVREAGWQSNGVGETIDFFNGSDRKLQVIGVVKDYYYDGLRNNIKPQLFHMQTGGLYGRFLLRIDPNHRVKILDQIQEIYQTLSPNRPFRYDYMDDLNLQKYEAEAKWKQIITLSAILMIFVSSIGLFGLAMLTINQRTKEIGIRKVLGASLFEISNGLSKNYISLVCLAMVFAIPAAYFVATKWLENFANRITISWWFFILGSLFVLIITLLTLSYQAIKAAVMNPVKSLRME